MGFTSENHPPVSALIFCHSPTLILYYCACVSVCLSALLFVCTSACVFFCCCLSVWLSRCLFVYTLYVSRQLINHQWKSSTVPALIIFCLGPAPSWCRSLYRCRFNIRRQSVMISSNNGEFEFVSGLLKLKAKIKCVYNFFLVTHLRAKECHLPCEITQCYLPPNTGERALP